MLSKKTIVANIPVVPAVTNVPATVAPSLPSPPIKAIAKVSETKICVKLPDEFVDYVRRFQYTEAMKTGNLRFSFKDAICSIISEHKSAHSEISHSSVNC